MEAKGIFGVVSRESALVTNNVLLAVSCFVVFVGTMWPLVAEMFFDRKLSVGPPFFDMAFTPFMLVLGLVLPVGAMLAMETGAAGPRDGAAEVCVCTVICHWRSCLGDADGA